MKQFVSWISKNVGFLIVLLFLVVHLAIINDYGLTWDFHFHFFGGAKLMGYEWWQVEPRPLPYVEPDPRKAAILPYGPLMSIPPFASWLLFSKTLGWLAADNAYNLPIIFWGVAGIGFLYFFLKEAINSRVALIAAIFLGLTPRYFGDLHNNMKDVPNAAIFALNIWLLWRLVRYRRLVDLLWAALAFAVAFNVKVNSIYIPIIFVTWTLLLRFREKRAGSIAFSSSATPSAYGAKRVSGERLGGDAEKVNTTSARGQLVYWYLLLAPLAAFLLWSLFWSDPIGQLKHAVSTFGGGTLNIEVLLNGQWYCSSKNVPWYYPYWYLIITTPIPILLFFLVGIGTTVYSLFRRYQAQNPKPKILNKHQSALKLGFISDFPTRLLLILWFVLPLTRYLVPQIGVIDGIRHFEEVVYPLAALAAIGLDRCIAFLSNITIQQFNNLWRKRIIVLIAVGIFGSLIWNIVSYHPFQITYFNELVGGVAGAFGKYDLDYWGTSQKQAMAWINKNVPAGSRVRVVMASDVAARYLREDLFGNFNKFGNDTSDYVVVLNRQSFFYRFHYTYDYLLNHQPVATIEVKGVPLVWIFDNKIPKLPAPKTPWWQGEDPCIIKYWRGEKL